MLHAFVNAASFAGGSMAAGEIATLFCSPIGPTALAGLQLDGGNVATTLGGTRALFDGVPAPLIYASTGQTSAIAPYSVAGKPLVEMQAVNVLRTRPSSGPSQSSWARRVVSLLNTEIRREFIVLFIHFFRLFPAATRDALNYPAMNATSLTDVQQAVRAALARFNAAAKVGDAAALGALLTEDLMYSHSDAKVENKAECIAALVRSHIDFREREASIVQVYNGGTCALVHGRMDAHNPGDVIVPLHFLMMWVKDGEEWLLAGRHTTRLRN